MLILLVDDLQMFRLTRVLGLQDLDKAEDQLVAVFFNELCWVVLEVLNALFVGVGVEMADVAVLVTTHFAAQLAEVFHTAGGFHYGGDMRVIGERC